MTIALRIIYLLSAAIAALAYAILGLSENYLALNTGKDTFYSGMPIFLAFAAIFIFAVFEFLYGFYSPTMRRQRLVGSSAILLCFAATFYFKDELTLLGDKIFFAMNKAQFVAGISDGVTSAPSVLFERSSYNFVKYFVYAGSVQITEEQMTASALQAIFQYRAKGLVGCDVYARQLSGRFYVLNAPC